LFDLNRCGFGAADRIHPPLNFVFSKEPKVIAVATKAPRGERSHAVGAHVAEGQGGPLRA
jgi:hypothetical protein